MDHIFIARHGNYERSRESSEYGKLTKFGKQQMKTLGDSLKGILNGKSVYLVSSEEERAVESSEILSATLGLPPEFEKIDGVHDRDVQDYDGFITIQQSRQEDAIIAVGHEPFAENFPNYFLEKHLRTRGPGIISIEKGHCVYIDLEAKTYEIFPKN